jgi:hypothetical protein
MEKYFKKTKVREAFIRSHNDLNTNDNAVGLIASLHQQSCGVHTQESKCEVFVFQISFVF